jgi:hypothetical protein
VTFTSLMLNVNNQTTISTLLRGGKYDLNKNLSTFWKHGVAGAW